AHASALVCVLDGVRARGVVDHVDRVADRLPRVVAEPASHSEIAPRLRRAYSEGLTADEISLALAAVNRYACSHSWSGTTTSLNGLAVTESLRFTRLALENGETPGITLTHFRNERHSFPSLSTQGV